MGRVFPIGKYSLLPSFCGCDSRAFATQGIFIASATSFAINRVSFSSTETSSSTPGSRGVMQPTSSITGPVDDPGLLARKRGADEDAETVLVADRPEPLFGHQLRLHRVSGDYWVVYATMMEGALATEYYASEFVLGVNGKIIAIEIAYTGRGYDEGLIRFNRIGLPQVEGHR
ncbi:hypothetical protein J3F84DRAFT_352515 [Trichoderma pleuroticola]